MGAGYHTDAGFPVTSTVEGSTLVLKAPATAYGVKAGDTLYSATGFATAGPLEADETTFADLGRTVDATTPSTRSCAPRPSSGSASAGTSASRAPARPGHQRLPSATGAPGPTPSTSGAQPVAVQLDDGDALAGPGLDRAGGRLQQPADLALERTSIVPGERAGVTVAGPAGAPVELRAYSRPSTTYRVVRRAVLDGGGRTSFSVTPGTNTRLFASCAVPSGAADSTSSSVSRVLEVRAVVSLSVVRNGVRDYTLQGRNLPRRGGQLITVYRRSGSREVILEQARTDSSGTWRVRHRFTGTGTYTLLAARGAPSSTPPVSAGRSGPSSGDPPTVIRQPFRVREDGLVDVPEQHLASWVGGWPPALPVHVVADPREGEPGWDGAPRGVTGVVDADGRCVVRVPAEVAGRLTEPLPGLAALLAALPGAVGRPGTAGAGVLRWAQDVPGPERVPDAGVWLPADLAGSDVRVAEWLRPFGGDVLVALDDDGRYLAGVGLKRHTDDVRELAVVTDERARGRGLATRLVAQAARSVLAAGCAALYLHAPDNEASARTARATGFPDTGWQVIGFWSGRP